MNSILQLKGQFQSNKNPNGFGPSNIPVGQSVDATHLQALKGQLYNILKYWEKNNVIKGALVSVYYNHVVAKSNRIKGLLCIGSADPNDAIRGSRFYGEDGIQHVFTYYVKLDVLRESIRRLDICIEIINEKYCGRITYNDLHQLNENEVHYAHPILAKSNFIKVVVDGYYVNKFSIDQDVEITTEDTIVTIYKTDVKTTELLQSIGIDVIGARLIDVPPPPPAINILLFKLLPLYLISVAPPPENFCISEFAQSSVVPLFPPPL